MITKLEKRIIDISFKNELSHLSSCLTAVNIIDNIYKAKQDNEPFVLDNGHAALALYCVLEKYYGIDAEMLFAKHGVHPNRDPKNLIWVSTGSLGQGLTIAVGMAISDRKKKVYVLTSDGAMAEGSNWEALRIAGDLRLKNLRITVNANGTGAYGKIDTETLGRRMQMFYPSLIVNSSLSDYPDWIQGIDGHYVVMNEDMYKAILEMGATK